MKLPLYPKLWLASFHSAPAYYWAAHAWKGIGFLYLVSFILAVVLPADYLANTVNRMVDPLVQHATSFIDRLPEFTIENGELRTTVQQPYVVRDLEGAEVAIFDTTGTVNTLKGSEAKILVRKSEVQVQQSPGEIRNYPLRDIEPHVKRRADIYGLINIMRDRILQLYLPVIFLITLLFRLVQALIIAAIVKGGALLSSVEVPFASCVRVAVLAITPAWALATLVMALELAIPGYSILSILVTLGYAIFAIRALRRETAPAEVVQ